MEDCCIEQPTLQLVMKELVVGMVMEQLVLWLLLWAFEAGEVEDCGIEPLALHMITLVLVVVVVGGVVVEVVAIQLVVVP